VGQAGVIRRKFAALQRRATGVRSMMVAVLVSIIQAEDADNTELTMTTEEIPGVMP
jgi:hypothetical protein